MALEYYVWFKTIIWYFHWLLLASFVLFLILRYFFKFENHRAILLFSLAFPGALAWCLTIAAGIAAGVFPLIFNSLFGIFVAFPSAWLLTIIASFQLFYLRSPARNIGKGGFIIAALIVAIYPSTTLVQRAL